MSTYIDALESMVRETIADHGATLDDWQIALKQAFDLRPVTEDHIIYHADTETVVAAEGSFLVSRTEAAELLKVEVEDFDEQLTSGDSEARLAAVEVGTPIAWLDA
jgi:hypothetical protein